MYLIPLTHSFAHDISLFHCDKPKANTMVRNISWGSGSSNVWLLVVTIDICSFTVLGWLFSPQALIIPETSKWS